MNFDNTKIKSSLEDLANEIFYEIFEYLNRFHLWKEFSYLNQRFDNLLISFKLTDRVDSSSISKKDFDYYYEKFIFLNKHRIKNLHLTNFLIFDRIFSPLQFINEFIQLECLILDQIDPKILEKLLRYAQILPNLRHLSVHLSESINDLSRIFEYVLKLKKIQLFAIKYHTPTCIFVPSAIVWFPSGSSIEILTINGRFSCDSLDGLMTSCPRLRQLNIHELVRGCYSDHKFTACNLEQLESISLTLDRMNLMFVEMLAEKFFRHIQILQLTLKYHESYLFAGAWQRLITKYLPNLRIFDIHFEGLLEMEFFSHDKVLEQFQSSFWTERQWFFGHQHDWFLLPRSGIFYSTNPYRRKEYKFHWERANVLCEHIPETNLDIVQHVIICNPQAVDYSMNYFPKATQLTLFHRIEINNDDDSISTTLNRVVCLNRLKEISIGCCHFLFDDILDLLCQTPNLNSLKLHEFMIESNRNYEKFQYVATHNQIRTIDIYSVETIENMDLIIRLFPKLEYFKTSLDRKNLPAYMRCLFSDSSRIRSLIFFCLKKLPKICLKELQELFNQEKLIENYTLKFIHKDLCLWL